MGAVTAIAQAVPILTGITSAVSTIGNIVGVYDDVTQKRERDALSRLKEQQRLSEKTSQQNADLQRQGIAAQAAQSESDRREALRRAVARQRAQFGSQGIGGAGGSSEAVLLGLFDESEEQKAERERLDQIRSNAIDSNLAQQQAGNLLEATQFAEKANLKKYYIF